MNLNKDDILVFDELRYSPDDKAIISVIELVRKKYQNNSEVSAYLANILSESGVQLNISGELVADVASTGGPSSLSTIVTPLYLRIVGALVPKLGVPGRPAGGIDCLAQIPGYRTNLSTSDVYSIINSTGYAHFLAVGDFAPLDGRMFQLRQNIGAQKIPGLVVSSLLAKKIAVGVKYAGLDIRVASHGNFGIDWITAKGNAKLFVETAKLLDIKACTVLTNAEYPYQPYIGRSEVLVALDDFFENKSSSWLDDHFSLCRTLAMVCIPEKYRTKIMKSSRLDLKASFEENLESQGATLSAFEAIVSQTRAEHRILLTANFEGFCTYSLQSLRDVFVYFQKLQIDKSHIFPDPIGLILHRQSGEWVGKGDVLASVRLPKEKEDEVLSKLKLLICNPSPIPHDSRMEIIHG